MLSGVPVTETRFVTILEVCTFRKSMWAHFNVEFIYTVYSSPNIVRVIKSRRLGWAGHAARVGARRGIYGVLVEKPEGKRPLWRPRRKWEDNIKMDF